MAQKRREPKNNTSELANKNCDNELGVLGSEKNEERRIKPQKSE